MFGLGGVGPVAWMPSRFYSLATIEEESSISCHQGWGGVSGIFYILLYETARSCRGQDRLLHVLEAL
jgi:hypothetical protein